MRNLSSLIVMILLIVSTNSYARIIDIETMKELGPNKEIEAIEIYEFFYNATENDTINCNNLVITTDFILSGLPNNTLKSRLSIINTEFRKNFRTNVIFEGITNINNCVFRGSANFSNSTFNNLTGFSHNIFHGSVSFRNASFPFDDRTTFLDCIFHDEINLRIKEAKRAIEFTATTCDTLVTVSGIFDEGFAFDFSRIKDTLVIEHINQYTEPVYKQSFDLDNSTFNNIQLRHSSINGLQFFFSEVTGKLEIADSQMNYMSFQNSTFSGNVFFQYSSSVSNLLRIQECVFEKLLDLRSLDFINSQFLPQNSFYNNMLISWGQIEDNISLSENEYKTIEEFISVLIALELNFRNHGQYDDEDACYYYRKEKERALDPSTSKHLSWITCGYFIKPFRVLLNSLGIIILFTFIFYHFSDNLLKDIYLPSRAIVNKQRKQPVRRFLSRLYNAFFYSTKNFLTLSFDLPQNSPHKLRIFVLIESVIGWFLLTLFIISLSRVYIR